MKLKRILYFVFGASTLLSFMACEKPSLKPSQGFINVEGGRVWYRIVGSGKQTPLLLLHGGPGVPSYYLNPLAALSGERPVIFYDQLGCGRSDRPTDSTLWNIPHFVKELATVRETLGLKEVHLLGHSWGTMLAAEYMFTRPSGVRSLILASPSLSISRWVSDANALKATLPDSAQAAIAKHEAEGTFDAPEYQAAVMAFYQRYVWRVNPPTADIDSALSGLGQQVYMTMCGPSEFTIVGSLKTYDCTARLGEIKIPTLFTAGQYDEAVPATVQYYQSLVPNAKFALIENAAHLTMQDAPEKYIQVVRNFLHEVEGK